MLPDFLLALKPSCPGNLASRSSVKYCLLSVLPACSAPLGCAQLLLYHYAMYLLVMLTLDMPLLHTCRLLVTI